MGESELWDHLPEAAEAMHNYRRDHAALGGVRWRFEQANCNSDRTLAWAHYVTPDGLIPDGDLLTLIAAKVSPRKWSVSHLLSQSQQKATMGQAQQMFG